ncbi:protocadherin alpha-4-like [Rhinatrema bivittatum]|uniref:protocadherin alpha-4-like n=1 Tax=Rhinatrema bivittatum TaxID=194408 RepID=UPI0011277F25|nr:protocadherin alpha-4-like [Rhinatrema bivittatum]
MEQGTLVGNISKDLGIDISRLSFRGLRITLEGKKRYFQVNMNNGLLIINEIIDREEICAQSSSCSLNLELVLENPLEMYSVEIEIVDINDNSPSFLQHEVTYNIRESAILGTRIAIQKAQDVDIGMNSLQIYSLNSNPYFELNVVTHADNSKSAELILEKSLDREDKPVHNLVLTAIDGGNPKRSGTTQIIINVIDVNDNIPVFDQSIYRVKLLENVPKGTSVLQLNATDIDEGSNGEISYYFDKLVSKSVREVFTIDRYTGVLTVKGLVDYEDTKAYEITMEALDGGLFPEAGHCKVVVEIIDLNDNAPEVTVSSLSSPIREDAKLGTVTALIVALDKDSGANGKTSCSVPTWLPFRLQNTFNNYYSLILKETLDRETTEEYNISIIATDDGSPPLSTTTVITVHVSDVNDNRPRFTQPSYSMYVMENNIPGAVIFTMFAIDSDLKENGYISYSLLRSVYDGNFISVNSKTGEVYGLKSFDYEEVKYLQFQAQAKDAGTPSLSSNVSLDLFIIDQNDNSPTVFPSLTMSHQFVPRSAQAGYLASKIRAVDMDSGYNAWLSYHLLQSKDTPLFNVGQYTGEIRTARSVRESDGSHQTLAVLVKDHGEPVLSSTVTVSISLAENGENVLPELIQFPNSENDISNLNLYLVISVAFISIVFLITVIILFVAVRVSRTRKELIDLQLPHADNGGSWSYSQSQRYNVCLSAETSKTDFIVFDIQSPNSGGKEEGRVGTPPQNKELMAKEHMLVSLCGKVSRF